MSEFDVDAPMGEQGDRPSDEGKPATDFKVFVGGISWHMDDRELKKSTPKFQSSWFSGGSSLRVDLNHGWDLQHSKSLEL